MVFRWSTRARLSAVALLTVMAAGCGGGTSGSAAAPPAVQLLDWDVHPAASAVLGQATFAGADASGDLLGVSGSAAVTADGRLFVAARDSLRVFNDYAAGSATAQLSIPGLAQGTNVSAAGSKLAITANGSAYIFNSAPTTSDAEADVFSSGTVGCGRDAMDAPRGIHLAPTGHLIVADYGNNRVLIWNPNRIPSAGRLPEPSVVVGQKFRDKCSPNDEDGDGAEDATASASTLDRPTSVWSDGKKLVVTDGGNNRVLVWDPLPTQDFQAANWVVGQANFEDRLPNRGAPVSGSALSSPISVDVNELGQMVVADPSNNRVLVWNAIPSAPSVPADHVIGQSDFSHSKPNDSNQDGLADATPGPRTLDLPSGVRFHGRNLIVTDYLNRRVLVFPASN